MALIDNIGQRPQSAVDHNYIYLAFEGLQIFENFLIIKLVLFDRRGINNYFGSFHLDPFHVSLNARNPKFSEPTFMISQ